MERGDGTTRRGRDDGDGGRSGAAPPARLERTAGADGAVSGWRACVRGGRRAAAGAAPGPLRAYARAGLHPEPAGLRCTHAPHLCLCAPRSPTRGAGPFPALRFPNPGPDFDARLAETAAALAGRSVGDELVPRAAPPSAAPSGPPEVALAYAANGLLQAKIMERLLVIEGRTAVDAMRSHADEARLATPQAPVLLVLLTAGVELDTGVQRVLLAHPSALLLAVHEQDQRKESYFGVDERRALDGFQGGNEPLRAAMARLSNVESMPMQRRAYLQRAMTTAICEHIQLHKESSAAAAAETRRSKLQRTLTRQLTMRAPFRKGRAPRHGGSQIRPSTPPRTPSASPPEQKLVST